MEEKKIGFGNIMIEVTRKCNLKCEHCLRGDAQNVTLTKEIIDKFLDQTGYIYHISLTGGEPFLEPDAIEHLVNGIIERKIPIHSLSTVENGTILNDNGIRSMKAINLLAEYIHENYENDTEFVCHIEISSDEYHSNEVQKAIDFYKSYTNEFVLITDIKDRETGLTNKQGKKLTLGDIHRGKNWIAKSGRAESMGTKYTTNKHKILFQKIKDDENSPTMVSGLQLCANGNIAMSGELSFNELDDTRLGNIMEESLFNMIVNYDEPLSEYETMQYCKNLKKLNNPNVTDEMAIFCELNNRMMELKRYMIKEFKNLYKYLSETERSIIMIDYLYILIANDFKEVEEEQPETILYYILRKLFSEEDYDKTYKEIIDSGFKCSLENITAQCTELENKNYVTAIKEEGFLKATLNRLKNNQSIMQMITSETDLKIVK